MHAHACPSPYIQAALALAPQDCNWLQVQLVLLLAGESGCVMAVGDDDQASVGVYTAWPVLDWYGPFMAPAGWRVGLRAPP